MTEQEFIDIFESLEGLSYETPINYSIRKSNLYKGLRLMAKYSDGKPIDRIYEKDTYSPSIKTLTKNGITEEEVITLAKLDWDLFDTFEGDSCITFSLYQ